MAPSFRHYYCLGIPNGAQDWGLCFRALVKLLLDCWGSRSIFPQQAFHLKVCGAWVGTGDSANGVAMLVYA